MRKQLNQITKVGDKINESGVVDHKTVNYISSFLEQGLELHRAGQLQQAKVIYEEILKINNKNFDALQLLGVLAIQENQLETALRLINNALKISTTNAVVYNNRGIVLKGLKRWEEAIFSFDLAIEKKPDYVDAYINRGNVLQELNRHLEALISYERASNIKPDYAQIYFNKGSALQDLKRREEALASYNKAIDLNPNYAQAYSNRGLVLLELNLLEQALASYSCAIEIMPNFAEAHYNRANALQELNRIEEALAGYNKAIAISLDFAEAYSNRGLALQKLKFYEEAIVSYEFAINIKPNYAEAYSNRGNALQELKRYGEALVSYGCAIEIKPDYAEAYSNQGIALQELKRYEEALVSYGRAIELEPYNAQACYNRGNLLQELKRRQNALANYDRAIEIKPNYTDAYYNRGIVLKELMQLSEAKDSFLKVLQLSPNHIEARWALVFVSIPSIFIEDRIKNLEFCREVFSTELQKLNGWLSDVNIKDAYKGVGSSQPFYLAYQELDNIEIYSQYGKICAELMFNWQNSNTNKNLLKPTKSSVLGPIKVGLVGEQFRDHSVWNAITKGIVLNLDKSNFEIHIFHLENINDNETRIAEKNSASYTKNKYTLLDWFLAIKEKELDVLIFPEVGMHSLTFKLAGLRLAPIQIASWGHPETTGLPTIDFYMSADLFETDTSQNVYTEKLVNLPNLGCFYSKPQIEVGDKNIEKKLNFKDDVPILLCPGAPFKYLPKNDWIFIEIIKNIGECKLIFFEHQSSLTSILKQRISNLFKSHGLNFVDYVIFSTWLKPNEFYELMNRSCVFLDTIGFSGFNTAIQAIECALPIVTIEGKFMRGRLASGILKRIGMEELITRSEAEYIDLVTRIVKDMNYRNEVVKKIIDKRDIIYEDMEPIRALEAFLLDKCRVTLRKP